MKTMRLCYFPAALFITALVTVSCDFSVFDDPKMMSETMSEVKSEGKGVLLVPLPGSGGSGTARSVLPDSLLHSLEYTLTFTGAGETITVPNVTGGIYTANLAAGTWNVEVKAYDPADNHVGTGSAQVTVTAERCAYALIIMHPVGTYAKDIYIHNGQELRRYIHTETYDETDGSVTFHLVDNITVTGSPVGNLYGTFDGHGYTIVLNINDDIHRVGLFATNHGVIKNLKLTGSVTGTFDIRSSLPDFVTGAGAVAAENKGIIKHVVSTVTVSATQAGTGDLWVGGIAGTNSGTIEDCSAGGDVQGNKSNTGNAPEAGGIAGRNENGGSINRCYAYGNVSLTNDTGEVGGIVGWNEGTRTIISNCAALNGIVKNGPTSTSSNQGRIAGYVDSGTLTNSYAYADMQIGGQTTPVTGGAANNKDGADIAGATLSSGSETTLWTASGALNWPAFQTLPAREPSYDSISPWYWNKTINIPANDVNAAGVSAAYVPALWFE
jgi:hypothetical protein